MEECDSGVSMPHSTKEPHSGPSWFYCALRYTEKVAEAAVTPNESSAWGDSVSAQRLRAAVEVVCAKGADWSGKGCCHG